MGRRARADWRAARFGRDTAGRGDFVRSRHRAECAENRRSEEHTSELQSQSNLVCRLLLEKKESIQHSVRLPKSRDLRSLADAQAQCDIFVRAVLGQAGRSMEETTPRLLTSRCCVTSVAPR